MVKTIGSVSQRVRESEELVSPTLRRSMESIVWQWQSNLVQVQVQIQGPNGWSRKVSAALFKRASPMEPEQDDWMA